MARLAVVTAIGLAALSSGPLRTAAAPAPFGPHLDAPGGAWRIAAGDVRGDGTLALAYVSPDSTLRCIDPATGEIPLQYDLGAFSYQVRAVDLNGDRKTDFIAPGYSGELHAVSGEGKRLWVFCAPLQLLDAAVVKCKDGQVWIACGGYDETLFVPDANGKECSRPVLSDAENRQGSFRERYINLMAAGDFEGPIFGGVFSNQKNFVRSTDVNHTPGGSGSWILQQAKFQMIEWVVDSHKTYELTFHYRAKAPLEMVFKVVSRDAGGAKVVEDFKIALEPTDDWTPYRHVFATREGYPGPVCGEILLTCYNVSPSAPRPVGLFSPPSCS